MNKITFITILIFSFILYLNNIALLAYPPNLETIIINNYNIDTAVYRSLEEALKSPEKAKRLHLSPKNHENAFSKRGFPMEIFKLSNLEELSIHQYYIEYIPTEISQLQKLKVLNLSNNVILELPPEIGELENLEKLVVSNNHMSIKSLLPQIQNLRKLSYLDVSNCIDRTATSDFSPSICQLTNLEYLNISKTGITNIPSCIKKLKKLKKLIINNNRISYLPKEIGGLDALEELIIFNNKYENIPNEIQYLKNLKYLWCYPNQEQQDRLTKLLPKTTEIR